MAYLFGPYPQIVRHRKRWALFPWLGPRDTFYVTYRGREIGPFQNHNDAAWLLRALRQAGPGEYTPLPRSVSIGGRNA